MRGLLLMELLDPRSGWRRIEAVRTTGMPKSPAKHARKQTKRIKMSSGPIKVLACQMIYHQSSSSTTRPYHLGSAGVDCGDYCECCARESFDVAPGAAAAGR